MHLEAGFTLDDFQRYIKQHDYRPELKHHYVYKLMEEVGELAEAIRKDKRLDDTGSIKGTIEEELYDVLYYVAALANIYDVRLEDCAKQKVAINRIKWAERNKER